METSRFIAYRTDENNYYDDSDFYDMILDTKEQKIIKHVWGSTRFHGCVPFKHEYLDLTKDVKRFQIEEMALEIAKKQIVKEERIGGIEVGDVVRVSNPRVRQFKGEVFTIKSKRDFKLRYGMVASTTLFGETETGALIKTSQSNVEVVKHTDAKIEMAAFRLVVGLSLFS